MSEAPGSPPPSAFTPPPYEAPTKKGMPTWAWVLIAFCGICCCGGIVVIPAILFPVFSQAKMAAEKRAQSLSNEKLIALSMIMYASDYDDLFPYVQDTASARELVHPYAHSYAIFQSPNPGGQYDMNLNVGGVDSATIDFPTDIPMWLETVSDSSQKVAVAFCDGHAKQISPDDMPRVKEAAQRHFKRPTNSKPLPANYKPSASFPADSGSPLTKP